MGKISKEMYWIREENESKCEIERERKKKRKRYRKKLDEKIGVNEIS